MTHHADNEQQRWDTVKRLWAAITTLPIDEHDSYLATHCGDDAELRHQIQRLLKADRPDAFLEPPDRGRVARALASEDHDPLIDVTLGVHRIERLIASGGMGNVYLAERDDEQIRRQVAIKVLKRGLDTDEILRRFQYERDVLAGLNHPGIAGIFDAGSTSDGRPYFVMPYVSGSTITRYCDERRRSIRERLRLFITLCDAVQYAHRKGVIHRDLKPGNVLIEAEGTPRPVIIDFGIARAVEAPAGVEALTRIAAPLGTPAYMSPEQADPAGERVDTRTDVYSLGVILYKLLSGQVPAARALRDGIPPTLSTVFNGTEDPSTVAAARRVTPAALVRQMRGELSWITRKAVASDLAERYGAVSDLADDVQRCLDGRAIRGGPPSPFYRVRKWIGRHRAISGLLIVLVLALACGAAGTGMGLIRARRAEQEARQEARTARAINDYLHEALAAANPFAGSADVTVRAMVDQAARRIEVELADHPMTQVALRRTIARTYAGLGLFGAAEKQLNAALNMSDLLSIDEPGLSLELAEVLHRQGRDDEAEVRVRAALEVYEQSEQSRSVASALTVLGDILTTRGQQEQAESVYRQALSMRRRQSDVDELAHALTRLALQRRAVGDYDEAESCLREALASCGSRRDLVVGNTLRHLGFVLCDQGRFGDAMPLLEEALTLHRRLLPDGHATLARVLNDLAMVEKNNGAYARSEDLYREALAIHIAAVGADHREVAITRNNLAAVLARQRKFAEARALYVTALDDIRRLFGDRHLFVATTMHNLGAVLLAMNEISEAEMYLLAAESLRRDQLGSDHPHLAISLVRLAELRAAQADYVRAEQLARDALAIRTRRLGADHWTVGEARGVLGRVLVERGDTAAGERLLITASATLEVALGPDHPETTKVRSALADVRAMRSGRTRDHSQPAHQP